MNRNQWIVTIVIVILAAVWKLWLLSMDAFPFNADEAIVGLMARHILVGERPIFFYGQAYMGSLDAYLVAGMFVLLGKTVLAIRTTQLVLFLGTIITTIAIAKVAFKSLSSGWIAALLLAIPTVNTTLYTTASLGGYGEALLIGNIILLLGLIICRKQNNGLFPGKFEVFFLGGMIGLGLWANGLTLIYSLPVAAILLYRLVKQSKTRVKLTGTLIGLIITGFITGSFPWWIYAAQNGFYALIVELTGSAVAVETQGWLIKTAQHLLNFILFGVTALLGLRPPWGVSWLAGPFIPVALLFWVSTVVFWIRQTRRTGEFITAYRILGGVALCLIGGFLFTPFGVDPSGRYFLPLSILLCLAAGQFISSFGKIKWQIVAVGVILLFQGWGTLECAAQNPPGITTQFNAITVIDTHYQEKLIQFLKTNGEVHGYTNYWVTYPLAFLTGEEVIYSPRLPYHGNLSYTARDDRYPLFTRLVEENPTSAYITTHNPVLDEVLRREFNTRGIKWLENVIGDYHIFYGLSRRVSPAELNISQ